MAKKKVDLWLNSIKNNFIALIKLTRYFGYAFAKQILFKELNIF